MSRIITMLILITISKSAIADSIWVITNNTIEIKLSKEQVKMIFIGASRTFPNGKRVKPIQLDDSSSSEEFNMNIMKKSNREMRAFWSKQIFTGNGKPPKTMKSIQQMINFIKNNRNSIGYILSNKKPTGVSIALEVEI